MISEGQDLNIPCTANGPPTPNITWVQVVSAGNKIVKSQGLGSITLNIPNIKRQQSGHYECQATNNPNEVPVTTNTTIDVQYPPTIDKNASPDKIEGWLNYTSTLKCVADGVPTPTIIWYNSKNTELYSEVKHTSLYKFTVRLDSDFGNYTCTAANGIGAVDSHTIHFYPSDSERTSWFRENTPPPATALSGPTEKNTARNRKSTCSCKTIIAVCVTIIVLLVLVIVLLLVQIWRLYSQLGNRQENKTRSPSEIEKSNFIYEEPIALEDISSTTAQESTTPQTQARNTAEYDAVHPSSVTTGRDLSYSSPGYPIPYEVSAPSANATTNPSNPVPSHYQELNPSTQTSHAQMYEPGKVYQPLHDRWQIYSEQDQPLPLDASSSNYEPLRGTIPSSEYDKLHTYGNVDRADKS